MNIVFVTNKSFPNARGSSGGLEGLAEQLQKKGHRISIIASHKRAYRNKEDGIYRFWVTEFAKKRFVWNPRKVFRILSAVHPDIVHTQQYDGLGSVARRWAIKNGVPWVQSVSDRVSVEKSYAIASSPSLIITPARTLQKKLYERYKEQQNIAVLPSSIDPNMFSQADGLSIRKKWDIPQNAEVLLSVSRVSQEKNSQFLFRSLTWLLQRRKHLYLLCVGGGVLVDFFREEIIRRGLSERVHFTDQVPKEEMKHYYASANVFVYVSKEDFRATVIAEAMRAGLPVVAIQSGGAQERIVEGKTGFVISEENKDEAFAKAVEDLLNEKEKAKKMGDMGCEYAKRQYPHSFCADKLIALYEGVIEEKIGR